MFCIFILGEYLKFGFVWDKLEATILDSNVEILKEVDDIVGEEYWIISQRDRDKMMYMMNTSSLECWTTVACLLLCNAFDTTFAHLQMCN